LLEVVFASDALALSAIMGAALRDRVEIRVTMRSHTMFPRHCKSAAPGKRFDGFIP
jgi:hypothetical protein